MYAWSGVTSALGGSLSRLEKVIAFPASNAFRMSVNDESAPVPVDAFVIWRIAVAADPKAIPAVFVVPAGTAAPTPRYELVPSCPVHPDSFNWAYAFSASATHSSFEESEIVCRVGPTSYPAPANTGWSLELTGRYRSTVTYSGCPSLKNRTVN